jgi:polyphosphate kinase
MSGNPDKVPHALLHNLKHNKVLHKRVVLLTMTTCGVPYIEPDQRLTVAELGQGFYRRIDAEIAAAKAGRESGMTLKMNSLEDDRIIDRLYEASAAGVPIRLIVRGICCLAPGVAGQSETIEARSIVDQFLEHARIYLFRNGGGKSGAEKLYLASADWMNRNLSRRVEVAFPINDPDLRAELKAILDIQLADDTKARILDERQRNGYARSSRVTKVRSQVDTYRFLQERAHGRRSSVLSVVAGGA